MSAARGTVDPMPPGGYFGRALVVDLDDGGSTTLPLSDATLRATLGGVGLGAHLLSELAPAGVEPLAPEAPLAFVFSPLVGTPLTTSAKFAVVAKSPLTDRLNDALASSHFAIAGKLTSHKITVGTSGGKGLAGMFFMVRAEGDSWEEIIGKLLASR